MYVRSGMARPRGNPRFASRTLRETVAEQTADLDAPHPTHQKKKNKFSFRLPKRVHAVVQLTLAAVGDNLPPPRQRPLPAILKVTSHRQRSFTTYLSNAIRITERKYVHHE